MRETVGSFNLNGRRIFNQIINITWLKFIAQWYFNKAKSFQYPTLSRYIVPSSSDRVRYQARLAHLIKEQTDSIFAIFDFKTPQYGLGLRPPTVKALS